MDSQRSWKGRGIWLGVMLLSLALTFALFFKVRNWEEDRRRALFENIAVHHAKAVQIAMDENLEALYSLGFLYNASIEVVETEFHRFLTRPLSLHRDILAAYWIPKITAEQRAGLESELQNRDATLQEWDGQNRLVPARAQNDYRAALFEQRNTNRLQSWLGIDQRSQPLLWKAMQQARDTGSAAASDLITWQSLPGIMAYFPIYNQGLSYETISERQQQHRGFVAMYFSIPLLMESALKPFPNSEITTTLLEDKAGDQKQVLHRYSAKNSSTPEVAKKTDSDFLWTSRFHAAGKTWEVQCVPNADFFGQHREWSSLLILCSGLLLTGLVGVFLSLALRRQQRTEALIQQRTNELVWEIQERKKIEEALQESNNLQKAILDGAHYSIISTNLDGQIQTFNSAAERLLGYKAEEVIGKNTPMMIHDPAEVQFRAKELSLELGHNIFPGFEVFVARPQLGIAEERVWTYLHKDGSRIPVLLSVTPVRDDQEQITGFVGIAVRLEKHEAAMKQILQ